MCPCHTLSELPDTSSFPAGSMQRLYTELLFPEKVLAAATHIASTRTSSKLIKTSQQIMELHHSSSLSTSSSSTPLFSPFPPLPSPPLPLPSPLLLFPYTLPHTSDGVVGGCEVGQCVEVPQEDAVLQTTADAHLSLGGVSQSFDVVLVCPCVAVHCPDWVSHSFRVASEEAEKTGATRERWWLSCSHLLSLNTRTHCSFPLGRGQCH